MSRGGRLSQGRKIILRGKIVLRWENCPQVGKLSSGGKIVLRWKTGPEVKKLSQGGKIVPRWIYCPKGEESSHGGKIIPGGKIISRQKNLLDMYHIKLEKCKQLTPSTSKLVNLFRSYDTSKTRGQNWNGKIRLFVIFPVMAISAYLCQALWPGTASPMARALP